MYKIILTTIICFAFLSPVTFAQTGAVKGTIKTSDGKPAEHVNITIKGTSKGTAADNEGGFEFKKVTSGTHVLIASFVGLETKEVEVVVNENETTIVPDIILSENSTTLQEVLVSAKRKAFYTDTTSSSGTRLPLKLIETPQTIQVITNQVLKDQQAQNLNEVTKNMTGVVNNNMYTSYTMRGFSNYSPNSFITFDGFMGNMYQWSQMVQLYNIDKVELISGPASALFSVGTPGGVINMVTKRPQEKSLYSFNATYGSWDFIDVSADLTGAMTKNKKLLYRLNVGYNTANSFRLYQFNKNLMTAPSLTYRFNVKTEINLDYVYANNKARFAYDRGGLVFMNTDSTYNWNGALSKFVHNSPSDYSTINTHYATFRFNHAFNEKIRLTYLSRYRNTVFDMGEHYGVYYGDNYLTNLDTINRNYDKWLYKPYSFLNSIFTTVEFENQALKHKLVAGVDYQIYGDKKNNYIDGAATPISINNPDYSNDNFNSYAIDANTFIQDDNQRVEQLGGYLQYVLSYKDKLHILLAGRYDTYHSVSTPLSALNYSQEIDSSDAKVFLPRFGLVYNIKSNQSVYASYCESFLPQYSNSKASGGPFPPQMGKQYELGYKAEWFNSKLLTTVALYNIDYINVLKSDPGDPTGLKQIPAPGVNSKGAEITAQGKIGDFHLIAGYAYNNVTFSKESPLGVKGGRFDNAPYHIANIWIKYSFNEKSKLSGFSVSSGGKYVGDRVGSGFNQHFLMPAYFLLDGMISYKLKRFDFILNAYNILNKKYIPGSYYSDLQVPVGTPANWRLGINYTIN